MILRIEHDKTVSLKTIIFIVVVISNLLIILIQIFKIIPSTKANKDEAFNIRSTLYIFLALNFKTNLKNSTKFTLF